jgi:hypothetical protein
MRLGVNYIGDLTQRTESELRAIKNFGMTSLAEVKRRLAELNLSLRENLFPRDACSVVATEGRDRVSGETEHVHQSQRRQPDTPDRTHQGVHDVTSGSHLILVGFLSRRQYVQTAFCFDFLRNESLLLTPGFVSVDPCRWQPPTADGCCLPCSWASNPGTPLGLLSAAVG